jgi:hypothetical protein
MQSDKESVKNDISRVISLSNDIKKSFLKRSNTNPQRKLVNQMRQQFN